MADDSATAAPPSDIPQVEGVEHRFVDANGIRIHLAEAGSSDTPPVLLLHGWPQHWYMWRQVIAGLRGDLRLLAPDLRAFGWSEAPGHGYDGETFARDQVALLDALGIERVKVIGHDWGGWTAMLLGLLHADRIEQMIVCNAFHPWPPPLTLKLVTGQVWRSWYAYTLATPGLGPWAVRRAGLAKEILRRGNVRTPFTEHEIDDYMARFRDPARAQAVSRLYRYLQRAVREVLMGRWRSRRLTVPTLHLFGQRDRYISKHVLPGFERYADDMRLELVPDSGHFIVNEQPHLVISRAREFFVG